MNEKNNLLKDRIVSVDVFRGLAMFLILATQIGGAPIFRTFTQLWGENFVDLASSQLSWANQRVTLINIPQSMFVFIVGLVIPFSMRNRLLRSDKGKIYLHILIRAMILFLFGLIAGGKLLNLPQYNRTLANIPVYNNVLEYISISYLVCAILVLNTSLKVQYIITAAILVLYWAIWVFIPAPGWTGDIYSTEMNIGIYIERAVLGDHGSHFGSWTGVLNTISHIAIAMIGVLAGNLVFSKQSKSDVAKWLFIAGLAMILVGRVWGAYFPIVRNYMTSTYVLISVGISLLVLALFYVIIDILGYSKWAFFFVVFGVNSIAIYMMAHLFDFRLIGNVVVGGFSSLFRPEMKDFIQAVTAMAVMWLIMYYMYRKKTFIKI